MLTQAKHFIENEVARKLKDWYFTLMPSQSTVFSPDRCCLSLDEKTIFFLHVRKTDQKIELLHSQALDYQGQDIKIRLAELVDQHALKGVRCSWILRPEQYQLLQTEALPVAPSEFQSAIRWKIKGLLHFPLEDALIDNFSLPAAKQATSLNTIMLVVARSSVLKPIADQINASGLRLTTIDIQELCFRNLTALYEKDEKSSALIFLREEQSLLIVTNRQKLYFSRNLDLNMKAIRKALESQDSNAGLDALLNAAALDIQRSFDYYQSQWRQSEPARIFLETRTPCAVDLHGLLSQRLNIIVNKIDVAQYFDNKANVDLKQEGYFLPLLGGVLREWEQSYATGN